tara:strand:- start:4617 stop:5924 length:1308 start_codon:yes stop_codon:yes gene_type:complete
MPRQTETGSMPQMATEQQTDLQQYCHDTAAKAKRAASELQLCSTESRNNWLRAAASALRDGNQVILQANTRDIEAAPQFNLTDAQIDRLRLNAERIEGIATALEEIADLPDPIGEVISSTVRPNGLDVKQVRVPLGVVFFIYESRPNVTADAAAICIKSGNAVILRGGKEAAHSSRAIVDLISGVAAENDIPTDAVQLVSTTDRDAVGHFLRLNDFIDVAIPRGGEGLIRRVADEATMPVIKHFEGNCHVYVDETADLNVAEKIVVNSKCQRMGVCNACESLLVHRSIADQAIPQITAALAEHEIEIRGDHVTCSLVETAIEASDSDYKSEFLGPVISIKTVNSLKEAVEHINSFGSHHTDAIVTSSEDSADYFTKAVDSSAVMVNASTRFNDGGEFGLGAEIGISTDKFHARGPCGLKELTSYKYIATGDGHVR